MGLEVPQEYSAPYIARGLDKKTATVCGMLDNFDENFGRLIARLTSLKLRNRTLVIFLGDDGNVRINKGNLRGQGYATPYEGSLKVPCFVQWPGHFSGGLRVDQIANHIDILPTLLDVVGIDVQPDLAIDGVSLLPPVGGENSALARSHVVSAMSTWNDSAQVPELRSYFGKVQIDWLSQHVWRETTCNIPGQTGFGTLRHTR